jgi:hypothetical protein
VGVGAAAVAGAPNKVLVALVDVLPNPKPVDGACPGVGAVPKVLVAGAVGAADPKLKAMVAKMSQRTANFGCAVTKDKILTPNRILYPALSNIFDMLCPSSIVPATFHSAVQPNRKASMEDGGGSSGDETTAAMEIDPIDDGPKIKRGSAAGLPLVPVYGSSPPVLSPFTSTAPAQPVSEEQARQCIEMLRGEDVSARVAAAHKLDVVAMALGADRTRNVR